MTTSAAVRIRKWAKEALVAIIIVTLAAIAIDMWRSQSMVSGSAPDLPYTTLQGKEVNLIAMSQEKPVLVYFWATWCPVCNFVSPSVDFMSEHYDAVTIALRSGDEKRVNQYLTAKEYGFATINDPSGKISQEWKISVTPSLFVIDKGEISSVTTGFTTPLGMWIRLLFS
ncbi:protein disulfide oxidoreductase [Vibrio sp. Of7-15]|uniref:protein disulfide oxidoreductase n=1 Tax=Vibrio sp. Of7-15 TaxID=2724879 RepID=UPI001EF31F8F|nr:protein disulfide oxidoreductase [Vibrio sp. Of7-15]MCG7498792.1 protein disulfide oxidoreductase [Vibrio sp. Of7-15]